MSYHAWTYNGVHLKIGRLGQYADIGKSCTVYEYLKSVFDELYECDRRVKELYDSISGLDADGQMRAVETAQRLTEYLDSKEFDRVEKKIDNVLLGLGFTDADRMKTADILSGGMKTKLILAKLLLEDNNILILDEPTNFLDAGYIGWLGDYLSRLRCAFIVISHDRAFLNRISTRIVEIANRTFKSYDGNYDYYLAEKRKREAVQLQQHKAQQKYIARAEEYIAANSEEATGGIVRTKATWLKKMLATLERIEKPGEIIKPQFEFRHARGATKYIMR